MKQLDELSLEELYKLFPITIEEYDAKYKSWYLEKEKEVKELLGERIVRISHIGSTAIEGMPCKPIVDILVEVGSKTIQDCTILLESNWTLMGKWENPFRIGFNQGYLPTGYAEKVFHLHLVVKGNPNQLYFRDMLNENKEFFDQYINLKRRLLDVSEGNRKVYTAGKTEFVHKVSELGKTRFENRYKL